MDIIKKIRKKQNIEFLKKHPTFCVLPFVHLQMHVSNYSSQYWNDDWGPQTAFASSLCCSAPDPIEVRVKSSLNNLIKHRNFKVDREMFYANKLPVQCEQVCSLNYKNTTKREIINEMHIDTISYGKVFKQPELKIIDYNFGNECNLACRMCSAGNSNQIAVLASKAVSSVDKTKKLIDFGINDIFPRIAQATNETFLRKGIPSDIAAVKEALPNLNELQLVGGEPFVSKDVEDILLAAIETGDNNHIELEITTNGTKFIEEKLDIFLQFKKIKFIVSIDGVGPTYDYIRYPFSFKLIEKRLRGIVDYIIKNNLKKKVELHFACMGILYNLYDYEKLYNFLNDVFSKVCDGLIDLVVMQEVWGPYGKIHALSWDNIPIDLLNDALLSYKETQDDWYLKFKEYVNDRTQDAKPEGITYAKEHTLLLDELHGRIYQDHLHPKLSKYIDSIK
jgi:hypothetical protein